MLFKPTTSILKLTLLGFILVAVPLTFGLLSTMFQVDRLAQQMQKAVHDSSQAVEAGRLIASSALNMERSAGQYLVLRDEAILTRYRSQRVQLTEDIQRLLAMSQQPMLSSRLQQLALREADLHHKLQAAAIGPVKNDEKLAEGERLSELVSSIPFDVSQMIARESDIMNRQVGQVQNLLMWQAAALIPLAACIAVIFSVLISRPLRRLGAAIRQLGAGRFGTIIEVAGPQDIRELGDQLDWLRCQLAELDEQKLQFLHHVSHELKTPLTAIREGAGLLRDGVAGELEEAQQEVVEILLDSSLQLQHQVESLLNFNLALAQVQPPERQPVDLAELVPLAVEKHRLALLARKIGIESELQSAMVIGSPDQLPVIIDNLLSNAVKHSDYGGKIEIKLYQENHEAVLHVVDQGQGIRPQDKPHLFEPFYQGESPASGPLKGTGLGLSIVDRYLRLHGGLIELIESTQGAHFKVTLPLISMPKSPAGNEICTS